METYCHPPHDGHFLCHRIISHRDILNLVGLFAAAPAWTFSLLINVWLNPLLKCQHDCSTGGILTESVLLSILIASELIMLSAVTGTILVLQKFIRLMWSFREEGCKQFHMLQLWPPMRRKYHLITIQIDLIWIISFWEQGSFGISLVYWHLHVLIGFLLVFNLLFLPYYCKWEFSENQGVGLWGWKLSRWNFGPAVQSSVGGLLSTVVCVGPGVSSCRPGSGAPARTQGCRQLSALPCCMCQRGRSPPFILRTCSIYQIPFFTFIVYLMASASSLSEFVLLCENPGANPARNKCLNRTWTWIIFLSPATELMGSLFSRLWCDRGTNHELCYTQTSRGWRGLLGQCLAAPWRGSGKPCSGLQQHAPSLAGFAKSLGPPHAHHHTDCWIRQRIASSTAVIFYIVWLNYKNPALCYCPCTDSCWPKSS